MAHGKNISLTGFGACEHPIQGADPCQQLQTTQIAQQWDLKIQLTGAQRELQAALSQGLVYAVCDGSFKDTAGAATWIIEGTTLTNRLVGKWHTPGPSDAHSSFHSKVAGLVGILYTLIFWTPTTIKPTLRIACDGLSVITQLQQSQPIEPTEPHFDLLTAAQHLIMMSSFSVELVFVRSHQDTGFPTVLSRDV